jgi:cytochrome c oxidase subunit II
MKLLRSQSICLALIAIFALASQGQAPQRIEIVASRYTFEPNTITLKKGVPVVLVLSTSDVAHGLQIKELGLNVQIPKGKTVEAPLTPDKTGTFRGKCSRFCGAGHGRMNMTVTVTE